MLMKHFPIHFLVLNARLTGEDIKVKLIFTKHQQYNTSIYSGCKIGNISRMTFNQSPSIYRSPILVSSSMLCVC